MARSYTEVMIILTCNSIKVCQDSIAELTNTIPVDEDRLASVTRHLEKQSEKLNELINNRATELEIDTKPAKTIM